jgi:hypothetical protein
MKASKLRELIRETIKEANFDDRLKAKMGMSDDEFEKNVTSRDIGSPFPDPEEYTATPSEDFINQQLKPLIKNMDVDELDAFNKALINYLLNTGASAQAAAKIWFGKKGL